ncbi:MAG: hypothetical protein JWN64_33 [Parcubacteria group bacterium]|nr:hypothetical protein [Parcubacteria group bacterium]
MEITTIKTQNRSTKHVAVNALAIVGFIVLVLIGMGLAVYAARFVPTAANRIGAAAVYLSTVFTGNDDKDPDLQVVDPGTSISFGDDTASSTPATSTPDTTTTTTTTVPATTAGTQTTTTTTVGGGQVSTAPLYGQADLAIENMTVGYCTSNSPDSFVRSSSVPNGEYGGISFTTINRGTNISGRYEFKAVLPTSPSLTYTSPSQQSLRPGEHIDSKLCFTRPRDGDDRKISIELDSEHDVNESNENNNSDSATINIKN